MYITYPHKQKSRLPEIYIYMYSSACSGLFSYLGVLFLLVLEHLLLMKSILELLLVVACEVRTN
jgi:hypothetical protein